jgi:hypothetical protein
MRPPTVVKPKPLLKSLTHRKAVVKRPQKKILMLKDKIAFYDGKLKKKVEGKINKNRKTY